VFFDVEDFSVQTVSAGSADSDATVRSGYGKYEIFGFGSERLTGSITSGLPSGSANADTILSATVMNHQPESKGIRWSDWKHRHQPRAVIDR